MTLKQLKQIAENTPENNWKYNTPNLPENVKYQHHFNPRVAIELISALEDAKEIISHFSHFELGEEVQGGLVGEPKKTIASWKNKKQPKEWLQAYKHLLEDK